MKQLSEQSETVTKLNNHENRLYEYCRDAKAYILITVDPSGTAYTFDIGKCCRHQLYDMLIEMERVLDNFKHKIVEDGDNPSGQKCSC